MPKHSLQHSFLGIALERLQATSRRPHVESQREVAIQQHLQSREANQPKRHRKIGARGATQAPTTPATRKCAYFRPPARVDGRAPFRYGSLGPQGPGPLRTCTAETASAERTRAVLAERYPAQTSKPAQSPLVATAKPLGLISNGSPITTTDRTWSHSV